MEPEDCQEALSAVRDAVTGMASGALVVDDVDTRPFARKLFELEFPNLAVLARREIMPELAGQIDREIHLER